MELTIKKCSLCGSTHVIIHENDEITERYMEDGTVRRKFHGYRLICRKCGYRTFWHKTQQEATDEWNNSFNLD